MVCVMARNKISRILFTLVFLVFIQLLYWEIRHSRKVKHLSNIYTLAQRYFIRYNNNDSNHTNANETNKHCIEHNICTDNSTSNIFIYTRNNFTDFLNIPVNVTTRSIHHSKPVIPRIVHFVLIGDVGKEFKFHHMLTLMAAQRFIKPKRIYFWHDNLPIGKYWEETLNKTKNLYLVQRERPKSIFGNSIKVIEHATDVMRLEALLEYGGIYLDSDSIVVNPIDPLLYFEVTMGREDEVAFGNAILFSVPWSDFFKIWYLEYKNFTEISWGDFSVEKPKKLSMRYPHLVHVENTTFYQPNYRDESFLFGSNIWDFKQKNYFVHLYLRFSKGRGNSLDDIKHWNTTVGQVMRYIYYEEPAVVSPKV